MINLFFNFGQEINLLSIITRLVCSIIIGTVIGIERERKNRPAGLRTHVLVCIGSTLVATIEQQLVYDVITLANPAINVSIGRLSVGVISGIGFIGAGTIMMSKSRIVGLTTAASLWCTACLGLANGMGYSIFAIVISIIVIGVLKIMTFGEKKNLNRIIEIEHETSSSINDDIKELMDKHDIHTLDSSVSFYKKDGIKYCVSRYSIIVKDNERLKTLMFDISNLETVTSVKIQNVI